MQPQSFHITVQGASHIRKNKECQDSSISYQSGDNTIIVVCDGHGGDDYVRSRIGAELGCEIALQNISDFLNTVSNEDFLESPRKHLKTLEASIINDWNKAIEAHYQEHPFEDQELRNISKKAYKKYVKDGKIESAYGTTLLAVAVTPAYWFGIHIGDGKCVAVNSLGEFKQPIPWDPDCFLNATTSICDSDAIDRFRHFYSTKLPAAVFIGSDGVDDCFNSSAQLNNLYRTILYSFATSDYEEAYEGLADYLPRLSAKGSGDDVSIATFLDLDLIPELPIVKEFDREKEKARVLEQQRKEAEKLEAERLRVEQEHKKRQESKNLKHKREKVHNDIIYCTNCGKPMKKGMNYCSNCGQKIYYPSNNEIEVDDNKAEQNLSNNINMSHPKEDQKIDGQILEEKSKLFDLKFGFEDTEVNENANEITTDSDILKDLESLVEENTDSENKKDSSTINEKVPESDDNDVEITEEELEEEIEVEGEL